MLEKIIKSIVVGLLLVIVYYVISWIVNALGIPAIIISIVAFILILLFVIWVLRNFGINL